MKSVMIRIVLLTVVLVGLGTREASTRRVAQVFVPDESEGNRNRCSGSLVAVTSAGVEKKFSVSRRKTLLDVQTLRAEGCGCYVLYNRNMYRGSSQFISSSMGTVTGDTIGFKIRSIERVSCELV